MVANSGLKRTEKATILQNLERLCTKLAGGDVVKFTLEMTAVEEDEGES
jgi:hypothetical protein